MRIAQVAPLWERVPPPRYGGIELIVGLLTDELVRRGHEVTLFASGDSQTLAKLEATSPRALRLDPTIQNPAVYDMLHLSKVQEQAENFDVIHFHTWIPPFQLTEYIKTATVYTLHGNFTSEINQLYSRYRNHNFVSISDAQRQSGPDLNYVGTVYNGIDVNAYPFYPEAQSPAYLAFLGRMSPQKGPHHAIAIAKQVGLPLKMAGKVDPVDKTFYEEEIAPLIDGEQIQFLGEVNHSKKLELLGNAIATLFPITWQEPFGLVMIESMCVGAPVIGMKLGSVAEVVDHGKTGFVCSDVAEMPAAIAEISKLNRQHCHDFVNRRFSVNQMVDDYEAAYRKTLSERMSRNGHCRNAMIAL
ncbi:MAG: glycosyltransferase family 4 protein [Pseudanabaenales cyanobacterium]|nr:glycosyltransferase family 4 protein [Pseudanabaenales cyanobacterium]